MDRHETETSQQADMRLGTYVAFSFDVLTPVTYDSKTIQLGLI